MGSQFTDLGTFDTQDGMLPIQAWIDLYQQKTGKKLNAGTMRKRRAISGLGELNPPRVYLLSRADFLRVMETPLPLCNNVVNGHMEG